MILVDTAGGVTGWTNDSASMGGSFIYHAGGFEFKEQPYDGGFFAFM
jgi:hypothetical protein